MNLFLVLLCCILLSCAAFALPIKPSISPIHGFSHFHPFHSVPYPFAGAVSSCVVLSCLLRLNHGRGGSTRSCSSPNSQLCVLAMTCKGLQHLLNSVHRYIFIDFARTGMPGMQHHTGQSCSHSSFQMLPCYNSVSDILMTLNIHPKSLVSVESGRHL